jgi:hypothetical protein
LPLEPPPPPPATTRYSTSTVPTLTEKVPEPVNVCIFLPFAVVIVPPVAEKPDLIVIHPTVGPKYASTAFVVEL